MISATRVAATRVTTTTTSKTHGKHYVRSLLLHSSLGRRYPLQLQRYLTFDLELERERERRRQEGNKDVCDTATTTSTASDTATASSTVTASNPATPKAKRGRKPKTVDSDSTPPIPPLKPKETTSLEQKEEKEKDSPSARVTTTTSLEQKEEKDSASDRVTTTTSLKQKEEKESASAKVQMTPPPPTSTPSLLPQTALRPPLLLLPPPPPILAASADLSPSSTPSPPPPPPPPPTRPRTHTSPPASASPPQLASDTVSPPASSPPPASSSPPLSRRSNRNQRLAETLPPPPPPITPLLPWSDHANVSRLRQLANVGQCIADTRKKQPGGQLATTTEHTHAMFKAMRRPMWVQRLHRQGSSHYNPRPRLIRQAREALQDLAQAMDPANDDAHARYALVVASYLSQAASQAGTASLSAERTYSLAAAENMLRLVDINSQADSVVRKALYAQALAHAERHQDALSVARSALDDFLPTLRGQFKRGQQFEPNQVRKSPQFQEMQHLLQVIIESRLRRIVLTIGRHETEDSTQGTIDDKSLLPRRWRREEMLRTKKLSNDAEAFRKQNHRRRHASDAFRALARRRAIEQLLVSLLPFGHLLSLASGIFPGPMRALDDVIAALDTAQIRAVVDSALALPDKPAAAEAIAAIGASLVRSDRLSDAISLYTRSHRTQHVQMPERFARLLIRSATRARHSTSVDQVLETLLGAQAGELLGEGPPPRMEAKTWLAVGGHLAIMGKHQELSLLWRRIVEAHPDQRGSLALQDQHLTAFAQAPNCLRLFKQHLAQYWNVPDFDGAPAARNPRKRDMTAETYCRAIQAHAYFGDVSTARKYLDHMATTWFGQDVHAFNSLMRAFVSVRDASSASSVWREMQAKGIEPNEASYTSMAILYAEQSDMASALAMLRAQDAAGIPRRQRPMTYLMNHLIKADEFDEAISIFRSLAERPEIELSIQAYNCMLKILVRRAAPYQIVMSTIRAMQKEGYQMDQSTYQLAMQSACDADRIVEAEDLFAQLDNPYQLLREQRIKAARQRAIAQGMDVGDGDEDVELDVAPPHDLLKVGAQTNHFTLLIHTHLRLGNVDAAKEYFHEMTKRGIEKDAVTWGILVKAYVETGSAENLRLAREIVTTQTEAEASERRELLEEVEDASERDAIAAFHRPSAAEKLLFPLLYDAAKQGKSRYVDRAIAELAEQGVELKLETLTLVLDAHRQADDIDGMLVLWRRIFEQATRAMQRAADSAEKLLGFGGGGGAEQQTHTGSLDSGVVGRKVQRNALCIPLTKMMSALMSRRRHDEVASIWQETRRAGFAFDPHNWNTLACSCAQVGQIEPALQIIEMVLNEMPPPDANERYREMREAIEAAFEGKKVRGQYYRGDEEILPSYRGAERREQQAKRQNPSLNKAFLAAREGSADHDSEEQEQAEEEENHESEVEDTSEEPAASQILTSITNTQQQNLQWQPTSSTSIPATSKNRHPILTALLEQDAIESAAYTWQPFYRTRREIAALLASRVGIDERLLETSPNEGDYLEQEPNRSLLEKYPTARKTMAYHIQTCRLFLELSAERAASVQRTGSG